MQSLEALIVIAGLTLITLLTRGAFFLSRREIPVPAWLNESLRYAPLAAMAAVVLPEILMNKGQLVTTMLDARIIAALAAAACFFWRRTLLGTIITGMAVLLPLRLVLGW